MAERKENWEGTAQELLAKLDVVVGEKAAKERSWPKKPNTLSGKLRRIAPALRKVGIHITASREPHTGTRKIKIECRSEQKAKTSSGPSPPSPKTRDSNKINKKVDLAGDDHRQRGDDPAGGGDDHGDGVVTITDGKTITLKPLEINDSDDGDDGNDLSHLCSERVCAQCRAGPSTDPPSDPPTVKVRNGNAEAWVHAIGCHRAWIEDHSQSMR